MIYMYYDFKIQSTAEREWFAQNYEKIKNQDLKAEEQVEIAKLMSKSQVDNIVIQNDNNDCCHSK